MTPSDLHDRPVRVAFPVLVSFAGAEFRISEFTANLSEGGVFLETDLSISPGTLGTLSFRNTVWEEPFTLHAEVVRIVTPEEATEGQPRGIGIRFVALDEGDRRRLRRLVEGLSDGSVVEVIRRSIRETDTNLTQELRRRPMDQKVIFALFANASEIEPVIRDGNPVVIMRLLQNPRLTVHHVRMVLRDLCLPTRVLLEVHGQRRWMADEEVKRLFCVHPYAPVAESIALLERMSPDLLKRLAVCSHLHPQVRSRLDQLIKQKTREVARRR